MYNPIKLLKCMTKFYLFVNKLVNNDFQIIMNEKFMECINQLRSAALKRNDEIKSPIKSPILRSMQIEEKLRLQCDRIKKSEKIIKELSKSQ